MDLTSTNIKDGLNTLKHAVFSALWITGNLFKTTQKFQATERFAFLLYELIGERKADLEKKNTRHLKD